MFSFQDLGGRYVLLDFWAVWCKICEARLPHLMSVWRQFGTRNDFLMVGLCLGDDREAIIDFIARHEEPWPQLVLPAGFSDPVAKFYGVETLPQIVLIGPDGKVIAADVTGEEIESAVQKALGPRP